MSDDVNYRKIVPADETLPSDYTYIERRGEIYDRIDRAGHHRNLEQTQHELADRYGVSQPQIWEDIQAINDWKSDKLGDDADVELETLKTKAVQDLLAADDSEAAYYLMRKHYETLMDAGIKDKATDKHEHDHAGTGWRAFIQAGHATDRDSRGGESGDE